ncbi:MAG: hypothetical protein QOF71_3284 [Candidatus Eremiobacteraeota bacterium]|nr:hypothetical protein [Candidatus Eremiobacteraeota bacterium]
MDNPSHPRTPSDPLPIGARVRVHQDPDYGPGPWPNEPVGTISEAPGGSSYGLVRTVSGPTMQYYVVFDEPQVDADGDGPYAASEILSIYLEPLNSTAEDVR